MAKEVNSLESLYMINALIHIIKPQLTIDYTYYNVIRHIWPEFKQELEKAQTILDWEQLKLVRERLRRVFELCGYYSEGIEFAKACIDAAQKHATNTEYEQAWMYIKDLGWLLVLAHCYEDSIPEIEKGLSLFNSLKAKNTSANIGRFYALRYLGVAHFHIARRKTHDFKEAQKYFSEAEQAIYDCPEDERDTLKARICSNIGKIAEYKGDFRTAEEYYKKSEKLFVSLKDIEHIAIIRINLARLYLTDIENISKPLSYNEQIRIEKSGKQIENLLQDAMNKAIDVGWVEGQARSKENFTRLFLNTDRFQEAMLMAEESLSLYRQLGQRENEEKMIETIVLIRNKLASQSRTSIAFVAIPMDVADESYIMYYNQIKSVCYKFGLDPKGADEEYSSVEISLQIRELIKKSVIVVADITNEYPNVYYEIGLAHQAGKPTILLAKSGTKVHFDIRNFPILYYKNADQLRNELEKQIRKLAILLDLLGPEEEASSQFLTGNITKISILFVVADPTDEARLRLGKELHDIQDELRSANLREHFELYQRMSVQPKDISKELLNKKPQIVHFSGHGKQDGALCVEDEMGYSHPIQPDKLSALFEQFADQVHCVILNACYSEEQAKAISKHINYVIGMSQPISDKAAIAFSIGFYQALGEGCSIEKAYKLGCIQIGLRDIPEDHLPVLIKKT